MSSACQVLDARPSVVYESLTEPLPAYVVAEEVCPLKRLETKDGKIYPVVFDVDIEGDDWREL